MRKRAVILFGVGICVALFTTYICVTVAQDQINRASAHCGFSFTDHQTADQCYTNLAPVYQAIYNAQSLWIVFSWAAIVMLCLFCLIVLPRITWVERLRQERVFRYLLILGAVIMAVLLYLDVRIDSLVLAGLCAPLFVLDIGVFLVLREPAQSTAKKSEQPRELTEEERAQYEQALQGVHINPQSFEAWANLGYRQHQLDKNDDALTSANKALALNKKYARAWMVRGAALSTMDGQEDKALEALERALIEEPNNVDALYYKGTVFVFQGDDNAAHAMFDRVLALDPFHKETLVSKGSAYIVTEDYDEALSVARGLIRLYPDNSVGWRMQGMAYSFQGEKKGVDQDKAYDLLNKALASFNKALEIDPQDSNAYLLKAGPYLATGDDGKALEAINQGLKINPTDKQLQEAKADIVGRRTKEAATKIAGKAGRIALGVGIGIVKGHARVAKSVLDDINKS